MDIVSLEKSDLFIFSGAGMEPWTDKILEALQSDHIVIVEAAKGLDLLEGEEDEEHEDEENDEEEHHFDPHVWLNPMLAKKQLEAIKNGLVAADPDNSTYYENNYNTYASKLDTLDSEFKKSLDPLTNRDIIVAHAAYGYICDAYNLNQIAIEGLYADAEPSPSRMAEIIDFANENEVKVIFFEELVSPKVAETIAQEVGAQTAVLNPLEGLTDEDLKAGKDYFIVMKENLAAIIQALQ